MAGDIATLGLSIDSTELVSAATNADAFADAANSAADAAGTLQDASVSTAATLAGMSDAAAAANSQLAGAADGVDVFASASASARAAMTQFEASLESAVGDINVLAVAQKNGTTLNNEASASLLGQREALRGVAADLALFGGSVGQTAGLVATLYLGNERLINNFGEVKQGLTALLTPTNLIIGGFVALAAGAYAAISAVTAQEKALSDLSDQSGATLDQIHALSAAAEFKGIDTADFTKAFANFGTLTAQAAENMGTLGELLRANGDSAGTLDHNLMSVADLVKNAATETQKYQILQQAGLPATAQWVQFLSEGAAGIKTAEANTVPFASAAEQNMIEKAREFDETWATSWKNFKDNASSSVIEVASYLAQIGSKVSSAAVSAAGFVFGQGAANQYQEQIGLGKLSQGMGTRMSANSPVNQFYQGMGGAATNAPSGSNGSTVDPNALKNSIQQNQQLLALLGPLASVDQTVQEKENAINLARISGVAVTKQQEAAILSYTQAQALGVTQINSQTDALNVQAATFGMTAGQAAAYTAVQTKINEAYRTGNPLTAQQISLLQENADALGLVTEKLDEMTTLSSSISSGFKSFAQDLEQGTSAFTALKAGALSALNSISDKLIDMASKNLVAAAFGGSSTSGGGGLLGALFGSLGGGSTATAAVDSGGKVAAGLHSGGIVGGGATFFRNVSPSVFAGARRYHSGDIVGGEIPIIAKAGEGVFTPSQMKALAPVGSQAPSSPSINIVQHNDFSGADPGSEARIRAALNQTKNQAVTESVQAWMKLQRNAPGATRPQ